MTVEEIKSNICSLAEELKSVAFNGTAGSKDLERIAAQLTETIKETKRVEAVKAQKRPVRALTPSELNDKLLSTFERLGYSIEKMKCGHMIDLNLFLKDGHVHCIEDTITGSSNVSIYHHKLTTFADTPTRWGGCMGSYSNYRAAQKKDFVKYLNEKNYELVTLTTGQRLVREVGGSISEYMKNVIRDSSVTVQSVKPIFLHIE